jgi:hypothetical protein
MRSIIIALLLIAFLPSTVAAQRTEFPADICCNLVEPPYAVFGPVRSVLTVDRNASETFNTSVETYDQKGRRLELLEHSAGSPPEAPPGKLIRNDLKIIYAYDRRGKLIHKNYYDEQGSQYETQEFSHDTKGRLSKETDHTVDASHVGGRPLTKRIYRYEPEQQTITVLTVDSRNESRPPQVSKSVFSFNEAERSITETFYSDGSLERTKVSVFDDKGNLIKSTRSEANGSWDATYLYTYKFDRFGNWIEREKRVGPRGDLQMTTFRVISYYDDR